MLEAETKAGSLTGDLLILPTISRDQTSESRAEDEKLTVLVKPASEADNRMNAAPVDTSYRGVTRPLTDIPCKSLHNDPAHSFALPPSSAHRQPPPAFRSVSALDKYSDSSKAASSSSSLADGKDAENSVEGHSNPWPRSSEEEESWRVLQTDSIHEHPTFDFTKNYRISEHGIDNTSRKASPERNTSLTDLLHRLKSLEHENLELKNGKPAET